MRTPTDALRSIRRWVGVVLPEPWDIQYGRTEAMVRPCGVITEVGPTGNSGSAYVRDIDQAYSLFLYPLGFEGEPIRSKIEARKWAWEIERALAQGFKVGGVYYSRSMRIPVFDYDGLAWDAPLPVNTAPYDYLVIRRGFSVDPRPDPDQDDLYTIVIGLTADWRMDGDTSRFDGAILQDVDVRVGDLA